MAHGWADFYMKKLIVAQEKVSRKGLDKDKERSREKKVEQKIDTW